MAKYAPLLLEVISLRTARGRVLFWLIATFILLWVPFSWLNDLSLWKRLGFDWAPSIGLTRAYWRLIHLDPVAAWEQNKLIFAVLAVWLPIMFQDIRHIQKMRTQASAHKS